MPLSFKLSIVTMGAVLIVLCIAVLYLFWRDIDQTLDPRHDEPYGDWPAQQKRDGDGK